jgi:hypothetical protein
MKRLDKVRRFAEASGIAVGAYLVRLLLQNGGNTLPDGLIVFISIAIVITTAKFFEFLAAEVLDRSYILRKLVAGDSFIEGEWLDVTRIHYGLISIRYDEGKIRIHGEALNIDGSLDHTWDSLMSSFDGCNLEYLYRITNTRDGIPFSEGFGYEKTSFSRPSPRSAPNRFSGTFIDFNTKTQVLFMGLKLTRQQAAMIRSNPLTAKDILPIPNPCRSMDELSRSQIHQNTESDKQPTAIEENY